MEEPRPTLFPTLFRCSVGNSTISLTRRNLEIVGHRYQRSMFITPQVRQRILIFLSDEFILGLSGGDNRYLHHAHCHETSRQSTKPSSKWVSHCASCDICCFLAGVTYLSGPAVDHSQRLFFVSTSIDQKHRRLRCAQISSRVSVGLSGDK